SPKVVPVTLTIHASTLQPPQAVPGGPYAGQLFSEVALDGSASIDATGTIASYQWSFGDGGTGAGKRVTHAYSTPGNRPVPPTIRGFSSETAPAPTSVHINYPPETRTTAPYASLVGQAIVFDASQSFDPDGAVTSYVWVFGDGSSSFGPKVQHAY